MRITIIWVGKTENASIKNLVADYLGRLRHLVSCQVVELRDLSKGRALEGPPALRAPAGRPCLLCRSCATMTGIAFVVASRIRGRRARRIRYRNYDHEYLVSKSLPTCFLLVAPFR